MPDLPLVSVVTCSYNNAKFIIATLDSIRDQTYPNIELVIVDDCSTDDSIKLIDEWLAKYKGVYKFIKHEVNKGGGITYNVGLNAATGKYYAAIDSDDIMLPEKIATQVAMLEAAPQHVAAVYSDSYVIDVNGDPIDGLFIQRHRKFTQNPTGNIYAELLQGNYLPVLSLLIKRHVFTELGGYDENLVYGDYDMWLRIACKYEIVFSDFISGKYRIRPGSMSFTIKNWDYSNANIFLKHVGAPLPMEWINNIAWHVYLNNDQMTMPLIKELACRTNDRSLMTIYLLWKFAIPIAHAYNMHASVNDHISKGLSPDIVNMNDDELNIFLNEIVHSIPIEQFKKIAFDAYLNGREDLMKLVNEMAKKTNDRYLITAYLLWKFRISFAMGEVMLAKVDERMHAGLSAKVSNAADTDVKIFLNDIVPAVPDGLLKQIVRSIYVEGNADIIPLVNELANKTKDKFTKAAYLLWRFKISPRLGTSVLDELEKKVAKGASAKISCEELSDSQIFLTDIVPSISAALLEKIALEAYSNNNADTVFLVHELAFKMKDRYLITVYLLGSLKIELNTGKEVLLAIKAGIKKGDKAEMKPSSETDVTLFLTEILPILPVDLSKKIVAKAYYDNNLLLLPVLKELARQTKSRYFKAILALWKFKINRHTGAVILERIDEYCKNKINDFYIDICIYKDIFGAIRSRNSSLFNSR